MFRIMAGRVGEAVTARQNGIHVSPTFMIDGVVQADIGSGDAVADWASRLLRN